MHKIFIYTALFLNSFFISSGQEKVFPGADESTPSRSQYFSWINNTNEGPDESLTLINLDFFKWLNREYGVQLDIYAFDAGAIDGKRFTGNMYPERFKNQFPHSFGPVYKSAGEMGTRLGIWGGPDGFGDTPDEEKARSEMWISLCRDYNFMLFKMDAVSGQLREEKQDAFVEMMRQCRKYSPDLILLNERLKLWKGLPYATTSLWESKETYIDVHMSNEMTAPHNRGTALSRGLPPGLNRMMEDHGVCLSSCLDYWEDDLVLQAFNRSLILAPQIYGNPWLLRDDEYPLLARLFNLHRKYRDLLINGMVLPEEKYGPFAVSRGDGKTRIITLRNLTWDMKEYTVTLNEETGLTEGKNIDVRQFHPTEKIMGRYRYGSEVKVKVHPFRACLLVVSERIDEPSVSGCDFRVIRNVDGKPVEIELLGFPGTSAKIQLKEPERYRSAVLDGSPAKALQQGRTINISFPGKKLAQHVLHRLDKGFEMADPREVNWQELYEATVFSADNNALEARSLGRSGRSSIPEVKKAQDAFFNQSTFVERGVWDKNLFDGNMETGFWQKRVDNLESAIKGGCFRLDLGEVTAIDQLVLKVGDVFSLEPLLVDEGNRVEISKDLKNWKQINYLSGKEMVIDILDSVRYFRFTEFPRRILEIEGYCRGSALNRDKWRASNLFAAPSKLKCSSIRKTKVLPDQVPENSYLCVALNGIHGTEGAYVAARVDDHILGAPGRAPSYPSNVWEYLVRSADSNYTYFIPLDESVTGKQIEIFIMSFDRENQDFSSEVYINSYPSPMKKIKLVLEKRL